MSQTSDNRSADFLKICDQFRLGELVTESSHPVTANLSEIAKQDVAAALGLLFEVDRDVIRKYRQFATSGQARRIQETVSQALRNGGKLFCTGCGATGRLSIQLAAAWREFWQRHRERHPETAGLAQDFENRAFAVMAGGDYAIIKSVEGFEDFTAFGKKQLGDLGVSAGDVVFAITEGGETSFVIGTAWKGVEAGAKVYFVYNNPDKVLARRVQRSREVLEDARIEKINLTTGPMAITGSTRMQATSIQLCVMLTLLEMVLRDLLKDLEPETVPAEFLRHLEQMLATLQSPPVLAALAGLVSMEEAVYRSKHMNSYFANRLGIDVLTDTTERSPTYCTPPFRKFDDPAAAQSWSFLFTPELETSRAWERLLHRRPACVEWTEKEARELVRDARADRTVEIVRNISYSQLMRFKIGLDGLPYRPLASGDSASGILGEEELGSLLAPDGFYRAQLQAAQRAGANIGVLCLAREAALRQTRAFLAQWHPNCRAVLVPVPETGFLLDGATRAGVKMLLNALSTCTMVRLGRVMGNYMIWVVASNLKLIDRATRYIEKLTGLNYAQANRLLFEVLEYVEPRMKADQAYPPVVGLAVLRARNGIGNEEAERRLLTEQ